MPNQPDNYQEEDCGQVVGNSFGRWNDENCDVRRKYICKHPNRKTPKNPQLETLTLTVCMTEN